MPAMVLWHGKLKSRVKHFSRPVVSDGLVLIPPVAVSYAERSGGGAVKWTVNLDMPSLFAWRVCAGNGFGAAVVGVIMVASAGADGTGPDDLAAAYFGRPVLPKLTVMSDVGDTRRC